MYISSHAHCLEHVVLQNKSYNTYQRLYSLTFAANVGSNAIGERNISCRLRLR